MRQWVWSCLVLEGRTFFFLIVQLVSRPSNAAKALKKREGKLKKKKKHLGRFFCTFLCKKKKIFFFPPLPKNLLQTHRPYSIPIKLYRASPALDCQRGPSVLIYRPGKHRTIMVINNNRIQYMTTWMIELSEFIYVALCCNHHASNVMPSKWNCPDIVQSIASQLAPKLTQ